MDIWDINIVLSYYENLGGNEALEYKNLVKKIVMLFVILGARRKQALFTISVDNILFKDDKVVLLPNKILKHSSAKRPLTPIIYQKYQENNNLCLVNALSFYLDAREKLVDKEVKELLISYGKPHHPVSSDTVARWIKEVLRETGVDTDCFKPHSCRAAPSSKARDNGVSIVEIMKQGRWKSESVFKKFYSKDIINADEKVEYNYVDNLLLNHKEGIEIN